MFIQYLKTGVGGKGRAAQRIRPRVCLTADSGVTGLIPGWFNTSMQTYHEIISTAILLPSADSIKKGCCQYVHEVLVNPLSKFAQEKGVVR